YKSPLDLQELDKLVDLSSERNHPLVYMNEKGWQTNAQDHPMVMEAINTLKIDTPLTYDPEAYKTEEKYQALLFCEEKEESPYKEVLGEFDFVRWHKYSTDILPKGGSKAIGIAKLMEVLNIKHEHAYAFGDGLNDREMLEFVPNSVAMGNAVDEVKQFAAYVTKDVDKDGIYHGLKQVGLL